MEVIKGERGRARVAKRATRPVTVRYRTVPMLTDERREELKACLVLALAVVCVVFTGLVEGSTWPA